MVVPAVTVTMIGPADDPNYVQVMLAGASAASNGICHVGLQPGETPQQAARRWAQAAYSVPLTPQVPSKSAAIGAALATIANDPALSAATKTALNQIIAALKP